MTWTAPLTAVSGTALTAAQFNSNVRDNLLMTEAALATNKGGYFAATGSNAIAERQFATAAISRGETTTSTSYVDLATSGPSVTVTTGTTALVWMACRFDNSGTGMSAASLSINGSTPSDTVMVSCTGVVAGNQNRRSVCTRVSGLTPGLNGFSLQYRVVSGTGTFTDRELAVMPL
jgi:hypothetical protein